MLSLKVILDEDGFVVARPVMVDLSKVSNQKKFAVDRHPDSISIYSGLSQFIVLFKSVTIQDLARFQLPASYNIPLSIHLTCFYVMALSKITCWVHLMFYLCFFCFGSLTFDFSPSGR